jgi:hypothetical protein
MRTWLDPKVPPCVSMWKGYEGRAAQRRDLAGVRTAKCLSEPSDREDR